MVDCGPSRGGAECVVRTWTALADRALAVCGAVVNPWEFEAARGSADDVAGNPR
jgi:hypothetical protein